MALGVVTLRPNSTSQLGSWTVVGAASAHAALSDNSDASYVQLVPRCRLDPAVLRVGFPTPTIPAGARVYSVGLRRKTATVVEGNPQPICLHWFRSIFGVIAVWGQVVNPQKYFFNSPCPTHPTAVTFVEEDLGVFTTGPGGVPWSPTTNLTGLTYDLGRDDDFGGNLQVSEVYVDVTYQQVSTVTVTAPAGTVATTRPTITWTYASPDSQPQQAYQVAIYTASQVAHLGFVPFTTPPIQYSGVKLGEDQQWTMTQDIPDGGYSAYVQASSAWGGPGSFVTAIASTSWTRTVAAGGGGQPAAAQPPNATLTSAVFDPTGNRVALTIVPSSSSPTTVAFTVEASRDAGVTWTPIPSLTLIPATGMTPVVAYDYTAPINVTSQYRVMAYSTSTALIGAAAYSNVQSVSTFGTSWWLKCPANPLLNSVLPVAAPAAGGGGDAGGLKIKLRRMQGTFEPLSGSGTQVLPIIVSGPTYGEQGELEMVFVTGETSGALYAAYLALDQSGDTLLLQKPNGEQLFIVLGPGSGGQDTEGYYNAQPGFPNIIQWRRIKTTYSQVSAPLYY